jgi:carbon monoxide dehydrogenase subunit G
MLFSGSMTLDAEPDRVWELLLDPISFAACVPGIENVNQIDERTFAGSIDATVGPISGEFPFRAHIEDSKPPTELSARVEGTDSVTKSTIDVELHMTLTTGAAGQTDLAYRAVVNIHGRLAIIGDMVLRATAALMLGEFTKRLRRKLEEGMAAPSSGPAPAR